MKTLAIQALRGPNFWSHNVPKLIQLRVELDTEDFISNESIILLKASLPLSFQLNNSLTSEQQIIDFAACVALALQNNAGCIVSYSDSKKTNYNHIYNLVFEYETERTGKQTAKSVLHILNAFFKNEPVDVDSEITSIKSVLEKDRHAENISNLIKEAKQNEIPVIPSSEDYKLQLGYGKKGVLISYDNPPTSVNEIFKNGDDGRIPIIAVTGSNGKTTTTRLIAHILETSGQTTGFTTSDGIYIGGKMIDKGDTTGPMSAEMVLRNKSVDVAVLETARGGIVRAGLGFDKCDIGVITNVQEDHLGISDIETMEDLTKVKGVVVNAIKKDGIAVLNADNIYTISIGNKASCNTSWFSMDKNNDIILKTAANGGSVAFIEDDAIVVQTGSKKQFIAQLTDIPITFNGSLKFMSQNVLAATLAVTQFGVQPAVIAKALSTFLPSMEQTPGRMNIFDVKKCKVLVDFAHNPDGFIGIRDFLATVSSPYKIGIIVGTGDRKEDDLREIGKLSSQMFDHILIHQVKFLRGRTAKAIIDFLVEGIHSHNTNATWERVPDEIEPLGYGLSIAKEGSFITALSDVLDEPFELIEKYSK